MFMPPLVMVCGVHIASAPQSKKLFGKKKDDRILEVRLGLDWWNRAPSDVQEIAPEDIKPGDNLVEVVTEETPYDSYTRVLPYGIIMAAFIDYGRANDEVEVATVGSGEIQRLALRERAEVFRARRLPKCQTACSGEAEAAALVGAMMTLRRNQPLMMRPLLEEALDAAYIWGLIEREGMPSLTPAGATWADALARAHGDELRPNARKQNPSSTTTYMGPVINGPIQGGTINAPTAYGGTVNAPVTYGGTTIAPVGQGSQVNIASDVELRDRLYELGKTVSSLEGFAYLQQTDQQRLFQALNIFYATLQQYGPRSQEVVQSGRGMVFLASELGLGLAVNAIWDWFKSFVGL